MSRPATHGESLDRTLVERRDPLLGTVLDQRFRIDQPIAAGGFGAIYRATDVRSNNQVALKVLHARFALDPMVVARFRREGKMLASLRDPHTVTAYEIGEASDGTLYMVMELLYGESLYQRLRTGGPLPWRRALHIASGVCSSLAEAHALGMVHRDLKPANIHLEARDGDPDFVKVLDFGIAKIVQGNEVEHTQLTQAGQMIGTLDYMSPEQMVGGELTPASDIFTLGVVMYEMITGQTPFATAQNPTAILAALLTRVPDPVSTLARVPAAVDTIVARCLARDSSRRYREVSDLSESLSLVLADTGSGRRRDSRAASGFELAAATDRDDAVPATRRDESIMVTVPNTVVRSAVRHDSVMATNPNGVARVSGFEKTAHANGSEHTGRESGFDRTVLTGEATRIDVRVSDSPEPVLDARGPRGSQQAMEPRPLPPPPESSRPPEPAAATPPQAWHSPASASPPASPYASLPTVFTGALPGYPNAPAGYAALPPGYGPPPGAAISAPTILGAPPLLAAPPGGPGMGGPGMGNPGMAGPGMGSPGMGGPAMGGPGMGNPGMAGPGMGSPGMGSPGMAGPGMGNPGMAGPGMGSPGMAGPGMGSPGMGNPGMGNPGMGNPGMGGPGMGGPGMGGPAMGGHPMGGHLMNGPMNHPMMGGPAMGGHPMSGPAMGGQAMGYPPMAPSAGAPGMAFSQAGGPPAMSSPMAGGPAIGFLPTPVAPARFSPVMGPPAMGPGFAPSGGPPAAGAAAMAFLPIGGAPAMAAPAGRAFSGPSGSAPRSLGPAARPSPFPPPSYDMTAATSYDQMVRRIIWIAFTVVALILIVVITR